LWSTGFVGAKLGLPYCEPITFLVLRFLCVLAILLPVCWLTHTTWPGANDAGRVAVAGVLIQGGYLGGVFTSIHQGMPAGVSALIVGMQPILTAVIGARVLGERTVGRQWTGLALGLLGVLLVVWDKMTFEGVGAASVSLSVLALVSITAGTLWQKRYCSHVDLRSNSAIQFIAALVLLAPLAALIESHAVRWSPEFVFALAWLVLVLSLGAFFLLFLLIRRGAATRVASLMYLTPPSAALVAWWLFGETFTLVSAAGMALAVVAVWLVMHEAAS
jgi:drug/metabolite transporter (DMT)-like permease